MTERLYYDDSYLTEFDAVVTRVDARGRAALDRSAFYPTSGGQPFDTGTLDGLRVTDVSVEDGEVWHEVEGALTVGQAVRGVIDWPRRFDHMQQHAADHMLAGALYELTGATTIGLHVGPEVSSIDIDMPGGETHLPPEMIDRLEALVNRRVQEDQPIRCWFPEPEELEKLPLRKRPTVSEHVRVVAMGDFEMVACGGTHPSTTGQIGPVKVVSAAPARGKLRLSFLAGMRAWRELKLNYDCAHAAAALDGRRRAAGAAGGGPRAAEGRGVRAEPLAPGAASRGRAGDAGWRGGAERRRAAGVRRGRDGYERPQRAGLAADRGGRRGRAAGLGGGGAARSALCPECGRGCADGDAP